MVEVVVNNKTIQQNNNSYYLKKAMLNKSHLFYAILCWIFFFLLNSLLFFPAYGVDCQLHPIAATSDITDTWWQPFLVGNYNVFYQLCGDFLLLLLPVLFFKKDHWLKKIYLPIVALGYLLLLYYNIYLEGYKGMYAVHPIFENDWVIVQEVLPTFLREISVKGSTYLGSLLGFIALSILIFSAVLFMQNKLVQYKQKPLFWGIGIVLSILGFIGLPDKMEAVTNYTLEKSSEDRVEINAADSLENSNTLNWVHWVYPDIQTSATLDREDHLKHLGKRWIYDFYKQKKLVQKPDVYLLFVESYGGVASMSDYCEAPYDALTTQLNHELDSAGWSIASNYSKSTVIGGRSWLAMTTAMIGARIEDQIQYSELINNRPSYPHMVDFFNQQGYETFRVSTMRIRRADMDSLTMIEIPNRFWKFDHRYLFPDIPYKGYKYDLYGGIPDQYTLGWATDELLAKSDKPTFYTAITMNSHGPWHYKMPPIVDDWRTLSEIKKPFGDEVIPKDMRVFSYWTAMEYQLKMLTHYIKNKGQENSVYIIIGDHNPGGLEYKLFNKFNKWATPIHIISKDSTFVESFHQHGFTEGMKVDTSQYTIMRHMGLYSLLTRQLLANYGEEEEVLPDYLPWGL